METIVLVGTLGAGLGIAMGITRLAMAALIGILPERKRTEPKDMAG